ncbi:MAG: PHP domain-containing protein [Methanoregula sp.]|nr:PHP domain-containing protein [Methanoregula sp.]
MKIDFHVHTNRSIDAVHSPRLMVKGAQRAGLDAIVITDHNRLFSKSEAQCLTREFGMLVIPGIEGGNIAVQKHWIALGIDRQITSGRIDSILSSIHCEGGLSIAPHPHGRLGYAEYATLGFDAVESLNGSEPDSNRQVRNTGHTPEVAGSDAHALPMLGFTWTDVDADATVESILESVRKGWCRPGGSTIPFFDFIRFYPQYITHRILREPLAAYAAARKVITEIRMVKAYESNRNAVEHNLCPR